MCRVLVFMLVPACKKPTTLWTCLVSVSVLKLLKCHDYITDLG